MRASVSDPTRIGLMAKPGGSQRLLVHADSRYFDVRANALRRQNAGFTVSDLTSISITLTSRTETWFTVQRGI